MECLPGHRGTVLCDRVRQRKRRDAERGESSAPACFSEATKQGNSRVDLLLQVEAVATEGKTPVQCHSKVFGVAFERKKLTIGRGNPKLTFCRVVAKMKDRGHGFAR